VLALLLVAVSVGLSNFGAATAIGVSGVERGLRLRVALIFGIFEAAMPVVGLLIGRSVAHDLGGSAKLVAGGVLCLTGAYAVVSELVGGPRAAEASGPSTGRLLLLGAALSIDNLAIGFALGTYQVNLVVAALAIGVISVALSLLGLELGSRLGDRLGRRSELISGAVLIVVGIAIATGLF
jgi:putative Mn2+ efflux pump MntP